MWIEKKNRQICFWPDKGLLISKCPFGVFNFFQKTNENKSTRGIILVKSNFFVHFLGELRIPNSPFEVNWPVDSSDLKHRYCSRKIGSRLRKGRKRLRGKELTGNSCFSQASSYLFWATSGRGFSHHKGLSLAFRPLDSFIHFPLSYYRGKCIKESIYHGPISLSKFTVQIRGDFK